MDPNQQPSPSEETPTPPTQEVPVTAPTPEVAPTPEASVSEPVPTVVPTPVSAAPTSANPGFTFGLVSLITALLGLGLVAVIFGILGLNKSKAAGQKNPLALAGIIIGVVGAIFVTIAVISYYSVLSTSFS